MPSSLPCPFPIDHWFDRAPLKIRSSTSAQRGTTDDMDVSTFYVPTVNSVILSDLQSFFQLA